MAGFSPSTIGRHASERSSFKRHGPEAPQTRTATSCEGAERWFQVPGFSPSTIGHQADENRASGATDPCGHRPVREGAQPGTRVCGEHQAAHPDARAGSASGP